MSKMKIATNPPDNRSLKSVSQDTSTEVMCFQPVLVKAWNLFSIGGAKSSDFSLDAVRHDAIKRSRLSDFGDMAFLDGLRTFLDSVSQSEAFHPFGRFYVRQMIIAMLVHRLKLVELLNRHPEILDERVARPVIVLGLPRTGTTLLFNLLAQDPTHRFMRNWESFIGQVPPKGRYSFATDPRREQAKWMLRFQKYLMPNVDTLHSFVPDGPEECTPILMQSFATQAFVGGFDVPAYSAWLDKADHKPTYQHHGRVLQALQWKYPGERWLLKSPDHLAAVDAILKVFPDACFVQIHRDPVKAVASWASLNLVYRGVYYRRVDTHKLGEQVLTRLSNDMDRCLKDRESHDSERFLDLQYADLMQHPVETVRGIYAHFGFELNESTEQSMRAFLVAHPQHQHGVHRYKPEDFGLTAQSIRQQFERYIASFKVPAGGETQ